MVRAICVASNIPGGLGVSSITAIYSGDANYSSVTSPAVSVNIRQRSVVQLTSSANPSVLGQSVTFTAAQGNTNSTGTIAFYDGTVLLGSGIVNSVAYSGQATLSTSGLAVGSHSITVTYGGDSNYGGSTSNILTQTVNSVSRSSTTITVKVTPVSGGIILAAVVSPVSAASVVTFTDNENVVASANVTTQPVCTSGTGQCVDTIACLSPGSHTITANYGGNTSFSSSVSLPISVIGTSTTVVSGSNPGVAGQPITLTATVSPSSAAGTVWFGEGGPITCSKPAPGIDVSPSPVPIGCSEGSSPLNNGRVTCTTRLLSGTHSITAVYNGSGSYGGSASIVSQTVR